jgi:outer membrane protein assembly factor BamB
VYAGCLYSLEQQGGIIRCCDAKTGKEHYRQRLPGPDAFTASPWANDGKVFLLGQNGATVVLATGPEFKVLATNKLEDMFRSSAAVVGERLLLRGLDYLYCIAK